jgi:hypothetical protein
VATRKTVPTDTDIAAMPPKIAKELLPERSFRSAWCWFTMISIPKIEKPSDKQRRLTRVEIICSAGLIVFSYQSKLNLRSPATFLEHVRTIVNGTKDPVHALGTLF